LWQWQQQQEQQQQQQQQKEAAVLQMHHSRMTSTCVWDVQHMVLSYDQILPY
jgi:hypothetical protein